MSTTFSERERLQLERARKGAWQAMTRAVLNQTEYPQDANFWRDVAQKRKAELTAYDELCSRIDAELERNEPHREAPPAWLGWLLLFATATTTIGLWVLVMAVLK